MGALEGSCLQLYASRWLHGERQVGSRRRRRWCKANSMNPDCRLTVDATVKEGSLRIMKLPSCRNGALSFRKPGFGYLLRLAMSVKLSFRLSHYDECLDTLLSTSSSAVPAIPTQSAPVYSNSPDLLSLLLLQAVPASGIATQLPVLVVVVSLQNYPSIMVFLILIFSRLEYRSLELLEYHRSGF